MKEDVRIEGGMKSQLVFIGGPPGVGKSHVAGELFKRLEGCVWLEGDDLWRMNPFVPDEPRKKMVERNIRFLLKSYVETSFPFILFTWVLHRNEIVDSLLFGLEDHKYDLHHFTLLCDEVTLKERIAMDASRVTDTELPLMRLSQTRHVNSLKIDTVEIPPRQVASLLHTHLNARTALIRNSRDYHG